MRTLPGALIVSSGEKGRDMLCGVLTDMGAGDISTVTSGAEARRGFADADWQVILINTPLSDEFGHELAVFAAGSTGAGVVLLVKAEMADEVAAPRGGRRRIRGAETAEPGAFVWGCQAGAGGEPPHHGFAAAEQHPAAKDRRHSSGGPGEMRADPVPSADGAGGAQIH